MNSNGATNDVLAAVVGAGSSVSSLLGPVGTVVSLAANFSFKIYQFFKDNSGAIGKVRKLDRQKMKALNQNLEAMLACQANDVYKETFCKPVMTDVVRASFPKTRGGAIPAVPAATLEKIFVCLMDLGDKATKNAKAECYKDVINATTNQPISKSDLDKAQKDIDSAAATSQFVEQNEQVTFIEAARNFYSSYIDDINSSLSKKTADEYKPRTVRNEVNLLVKSCFLSYMSAHVDKKQPHNFTEAKNFSNNCENLFACSSIMGHPGKDIFTKNSQNYGDDQSVCYGLVKLGTDFDDTEITDDLLAAKFDNAGRCEKPVDNAAPGKNDNAGSESKIQ